MKSDFLIVEGGKEIKFLPRIVIPGCLKDYTELSSGLALAAWGDWQEPQINSVNEIYTLFELIRQESFLLPGLNCGSCNREDCCALAREIVAGKATTQECKALNSQL